MRLIGSINPVTLRELRQMTRSRLVASGLITFLVLQLVCVSFNLLASRDALQDGLAFGGMALGQTLFSTNYFLLSGLLLFCITLYVGIRMGIERGADHLDLQFTTALTPCQFTNGKIISALILILIFASAALPFMVLSYLLRGIDLVGVLLAFALLLVTAVCCVYGVLLLSALATSWLFRGLGALATLAFLYLLFEQITMGGNALATSESSISFASWEECEGVAFFLFACVCGCLLSHMATVAALSPSHANRDLPLRLCVTGVVLAWGGISLACFLYDSTIDYLFAWAFGVVFISAILLCISASRASGGGRRILAAVSSKRWRRFFQFPYFSGAENGMVWALGMGLSCVAIFMEIDNCIAPDLLDGCPTALHVAVLFFYLSAYICTVRALWYFLLRERLSHRFVGLISVALIVLGSALPYLLALGNGQNQKEVAWAFGNIFEVVYNTDDFDVVCTHLLYSGVWVLLAVTACAPSFRDAFKRFIPSQEVQQV